MEKQTQIKCPNCGLPFNVNEILYNQLEDELKLKYDQQIIEEKKKFEKRSEELKQAQEKLAMEKTNLEDQINEGVRNKLKSEKDALEKKLRLAIEEEESEKFKTLQEELNEKSIKLREFNKARAEIERLKREKEELRESIQAETEKVINEKILAEKENIRKVENERHQLVIKELEKKLTDQKKLTDEMQRKYEQGSMQMQGEVQELAIEDWLREKFPLDSIEDIKKGTAGGDCIQIVNTRTRPNCGSVYYESKRTKAFGGDWIEKFKADMRAKGVTVGVLVTQTMPKDMDRMGLKEGIWICNFEEFKGLSAVLRESVVRISEITGSQQNKGDKMSMLYDFLVSQEFKAQIESIVEGFTQMKTDLDSEKRAMQKIWKAREKQIDKVVLNTTHMYGAIKGIAGSAIGTVPALELGESSNDKQLNP